ncbi:MAG: hypothetical protein ACKVHL_00330, partial [Rhodospirillales bacterium]
MAKATTTPESDNTEAVRYTLGASGPVYGAKDKDGNPVPASPPAPKPAAKPVAKKATKKVAKKAAPKKPAAPFKAPTTAKE